MKVKVTANTAASGKPLKANKVYTVPKDFSEEDAYTLIKLRKAEIVEQEESAEKGAKSTKEDSQDDAAQ